MYINIYLLHTDYFIYIKNNKINLEKKDKYINFIDMKENKSSFLSNLTKSSLMSNLNESSLMTSHVTNIEKGVK